MIESKIGRDWTVQNLLEAMAVRDAAPAVIAFEGDAAAYTSYGELADRIRRLASGMVAAGIEPGAEIGLYAPNSVAWLVVRLAAGVAGAVTVALDDLMGESEAAEMLRECDCRWLFTTQEHAGALATVAPALVVEVLILDDQPAHAGAACGRNRGWHEMFAETPAALPTLDAATPTALVFTSGTTGAPKSFSLSHANLAANVGPLVAEHLIGPRDRVLLPLPLHHVYPLVVGMLTTLASGAALVFPEAVTGPRIVHALRAGEVTAMVGVPRLYTALLANLEDRVRGAGGLAAMAFRGMRALTAGLRRATGFNAGRWVFRPLHRQFAPALRLMACGGAHLDTASAQALEQFGWQVLAGYGLAETASMFTANFPGRQRIGSEGRALPGGEVRIASPDREGVGEIELRGVSVFEGYRNNPSANATAFTDDGWFRTGDLGWLDDDGYLYVTGRSKELIVLGGGKNVYPEEVEQAYGVSPVVEEIAVLEQAGQLVALVRPNLGEIRAGGVLSVAEATRVGLAEAGQALPSYERLAGYALTNETLPRTRLGKYRRFLLPDIYQRAISGAATAEAEPLSAEDESLIALPIAGEVWQWLNTRYPDRPISPATSLQLDLGIDSLEWLRLSLELAERFGVELDEADIADMVSVRDLLERAARRSAQAPAPKQVPIARDPATYVAPAGPGLKLLGMMVYVFTWCFMRALFRLSVRGAKNIPESGPAVIVANHASYLDALVIAAALSRKRAGHMFFGGAVQILFQTWHSRVFCRVAHVFPIDERTPKTTLDIGGAILARGDALTWFPEAWRTPTGELQAFRSGIGTLLTMHPAPVVPARIEGTFAALPRTRRWPRLLPLTVTFGPSADVAELAREGSGESAEARIANALHDRVAALGEAADLPQQLRGK
jgi:long-chain acyl-CoA synthetase